MTLSKKSFPVFLISAIFIFTGCSQKNLLVPGKEYSDCETGVKAKGVCGSPDDIYKNKEVIRSAHREPDGAYRITKEGKVIDINSKKIVAIKSEPEEGVKIKNNSLVIRHPQESAIIRDLGYIQRVWIAPYENENGDLVSAHDIYVVVKKPKWIIGESYPKKLNKGVVLPSLIAEKVIKEKHRAPDLKAMKKIKDLVYDDKKEDKEIIKIKNFVKEEK